MGQPPGGYAVPSPLQRLRDSGVFGSVPSAKALGSDMSTLRASGMCDWNLWRRYGSGGRGRVIFKFEDT